MMQTLLTGLIVAACAGYVLWKLLLPAAWRGRILRALGRQAPPSAGACGCDGCEQKPAAAKPQTQVVHWMPRRRR